MKLSFYLGVCIETRHDEEYKAKISDFGLVKIKLESGSSTTLRKLADTIHWRAPVGLNY